MGNSDSRLRALLHWLRDRVVQPVPDKVAGCEYDCREPDCGAGDWESCPKRLREASLRGRKRRRH